MNQAESAQDWERQVMDARAKDEYERAGLLCEQQIQIEPEDRQAYWHLGLVRLLQEQEEEAQLTWMTVLADAPPEEAANWEQELLTVLEYAAQEQIQLGHLQLAWTIRHYIRELAPTHIENLLRLIQLAIKLETFQPEDLVALEVIEQLQNPPGKVPEDLLRETVAKLPDTMLGHPMILTFVAACVPHGQQTPSAWVSLFTDKMLRLARFWRESMLACRYGELGLALGEQDSDFMLLLASYYYATAQYDRGITLAQQCYQESRTLLDQLNACNNLLTGYMRKGGLWAEAEHLLREQTQLLQRWLTEMPVELDYLVSSSIFCNALFAYAYFGDRPRANRQLHNQLAQWYQQSLYAYLHRQGMDHTPCLRRPGRPLAPDRRLRIGYLSRSMIRHSVGWISRWLFHYHDREKFEIFAYFTHMLKADDVSQQWFIQNADHAVYFEEDILTIARTIQDHEIDILVDLDSLTVDINYSVMALKPAPVQVTWLGLDAPGLPTVDYFIVDPYVVPENAQEYYSEKLWVMPQTYVAVDGFEVGVPTLRRSDLDIPADAVVYFSAQQAFKCHPEIVRTQLQILQTVPDSYFLIKGIGPGIQAMFRQMAAEIGVSSDRLRFLGGVRYEENHRANLGIADVVLDTFPYNGATTTLETLWMGIPLVTRVGQQFAARNSYTMMINAGIKEGIAWSNEEYLDWGVRLGKDADLRTQIRWKLHQSKRTSPLWYGKQFTRQMETAYEQMWTIHCQGGKGE
jgi:predicted O-linked N-acetylglucosamine transferase (SPINDLY family)